MKVNRLENYLVKIYQAGIKSQRQSLLMLGPPGSLFRSTVVTVVLSEQEIGKSWQARGAAEKMAKLMKKTFIDYNDDVAQKILAEPDRFFVFVDLRLTECEPSDLCGIPNRIDDSVKFSPLLWARCLSRAAGLLLLDESDLNSKTGCFITVF